jgi:hypothetical protein
MSKNVNPVDGVLGMAKIMLLGGKSGDEVLKALIARYLEAGKDAKQAKHNAQSTLFHAKRRVNPTQKTKTPKAIKKSIPKSQDVVEQNKEELTVDEVVQIQPTTPEVGDRGNVTVDDEGFETTIHSDTQP